jgi:hypothetical protein
MNRQIGLAIGDIETVKKDAKLKREAMQVRYLGSFDLKKKYYKYNRY